ASGVAQGDFAVGIDAVGAGAPLGLGVGVRGGLGQGGVGLCWGAAADGAVWAVVVVPVLEAIKQGLQLGERGWSWAGGEPAFEGLVEAFDLALGLGVAGAAVLLLDAVGVQEFLEAVTASFAAGQASGGDQAV